MVIRELKQKASLLVVSVTGLVLIGLPAVAYAQSSSASYKVEESQFGIGGDLDSASASYKAQLSAGANAAGNTSSTNYSSIAGFLSPREEYLEMIVNASTINLGTLSTGSTATGTATFFVRAYTSSGYNVISSTPPPTNGSRQLAPMTSTGSSSSGTEQFGLNLVANTSPATFGADPAPAPDNTFANGVAATGYDTTNQFKYNAGDIIATSPKGIGRTDFTISYIANIAPLTPGGLYTVNQELIVVASY